MTSADTSLEATTSDMASKASSKKDGTFEWETVLPTLNDKYKKLMSDYYGFLDREWYLELYYDYGEAVFQLFLFVKGNNEELKHPLQVTSSFKHKKQETKERTSLVTKKVMGREGEEINSITYHDVTKGLKALLSEEIIVKFKIEKQKVSKDDGFEKEINKYLLSIHNALQKQSLTTKNCLRILELTEKYDSKEHQEKVLNFVAKHFQDLKKADWSSFSKKHVELTNKVYEYVSSHALSKQKS